MIGKYYITIEKKYGIWETRLRYVSNHRSKSVSYFDHRISAYKEAKRLRKIHGIEQDF